jgi:PAS domain S-box-containing protein
MSILPCGFLSTSEEGRIIFLNKYLIELLAVKEDEVVGQKLLHDFFPVGVKVYFETHIRPLLLMQGAVHEISIELVRSDQSRISVLMNAILKKDAEDVSTTVCYTFFDISQRKKYERELLLAAEKQKELSLQLQITNTQIQEANAYYKSIIENKSFYIIKLDLKSNFTYLNPSYRKKMRLEEEDQLGKSALKLVLPEDHYLFIAAMETTLADPDKTHWITIRMLSPEEILTFQWEFSLIRDEKQNFFSFLAIGHDITPLIKKQEDLQTLADITSLQNKRLNNFAYIISHNIRSHVANLRGIIDVTDMGNQEDRNRSFGMLNKSVNTLDETIRHLNNVLSIQDNTNLPKKLLNVKDEINKVLEIIQIQVSSSNASVHCNLFNEEYITTNPAYFESILLNLLTNAIKYRSPDRNPNIYISLTKEGDYKTLVVEDNGLGIDLDKYQDQLFGMYKTFHGNKDAKGLGLFITKTQIESIRGKIEVKSAIGVGTTFRVYFPLS